MIKDFKNAVSFIFQGMASPTREGLRIIIYSLAIPFAGLFLFVFTGYSFLIWLGVLGTFFCLYFFRNPDRTAVYGKDEIISPADGRVMSIKPEGDPDITVIRIFLSIFDVHVQRSPIEGIAGKPVYTKGSFAFANATNADKNERNYLPIKAAGKKRFAHIEQITGAVARRIVCWPQEGQKLAQGELVGLIHFGSQVAVYIPSSCKVLVKKGQKVEGGFSVLALFEDKK